MAKKAMPRATLEGQVLGKEELKQIDIFGGVPEMLMDQFPGTVTRRVFKPGEVICRQGEGGTTAFYIVEGTCKIFIQRATQGRKRRKGFIAKLGEVFGQKQATLAPRHRDDELVAIDASVDLTYGNLAARLQPGDVVGEMSCLNHVPRSATVVAETECVLLEILRNMYEHLLRSKPFKEKVDKRYTEKALDNHLKNSWLFEGLADPIITEIKAICQLVSVDSGKVIFKEGDAPDGMYLIRRGQVKVTKSFAGGERGLAYLTKGDCFGEIGLLRNEPRSATCAADDHPVGESGAPRPPAKLELVKVGKDEFQKVLTAHPEVRERLETLSQKRLKQQEEVRSGAAVSVHSKRIDELGLLQGQNLMLIDLERCTRCDQCAKACSEAHEDGLSRLIREGPRFDKYLVPASCRMCMDPVCMIGCPVASIRKGKDLNIVIEDWCVGCGKCSRQCPYNSIQMYPLEALGEDVAEEARRRSEAGESIEVDERAVVCDQCSSLPQGPSCVYACPHDAAMRVNFQQFVSMQLSAATGG